jgi:hypothetical protein
MLAGFIGRSAMSSVCSDCSQRVDIPNWNRHHCSGCWRLRQDPGLAQEILDDGGFVPASIIAALGLDDEHDVGDAEDVASDTGAFGAPSSPGTVTAAPAPPQLPRATAVQKIPQPYYELLQATGFLDYVDSNLDVLRLWDYEAFKHGKDGAIGMAQVINGLRYADIATRGRSDIQNAATLVHEAAHLSGIAQTGQMFLDEAIAEAVMNHFLDSARAMFEEED